MFTAQHRGQRFKVAVAAAGDRFAPSAVIDKSVDGFLEHTFFVVNDGVGRAEFFQMFQTIVTVDNASVKVVKVARCETSAVKLNHRAKFGRENGDNVQNHPFGAVAADAERFHDFKTFYRAQSFLSDGIRDDVFQNFAFLIEVDFDKKFFYSLRTHSDAESLAAVFFAKFAIFTVGKDLFFVDFGDFARIENDMGYEVQNLFKLLRGNIRHKADTRRNAAEIPDVRYGRRKFDMSHTFATDFRFRYFDAALFADDALVTDAFIFAAVAFPVFRGPEDFLAEKSAGLGFLCSVIYRFGFKNLAVRPFPDFFRAGNTDLH